MADIIIFIFQITGILIGLGILGIVCLTFYIVLDKIIQLGPKEWWDRVWK